MNPSPRPRPRAFQLIIERFFPHVDVTLGAFHSLHAGERPVNKDFVAYGFLSSLRWAACSEATLAKGSKFYVLSTAIIDNPFVGPAQKKDIQEKFGSAQRVYHTLCRGARQWKVSRARRSEVDRDLYMRPFADLPAAALMELYHDDSRTIYTYRISDLLRIIKSSLCSAPDFFVAPQPIRNPYTNQEFTSAQLYAVYDRVKHSAYEIPTVFHMYRAAGMQARELVDKGEAFIREEAIDDAQYLPEDRRHRYILQMLREYERDVRELNIHPRFPVALLVAAFSPFLPTYLRTTHSLHPDLRRRSKLLLRETLRRFAELNPSYGQVRVEAESHLDQNTSEALYHTDVVPSSRLEEGTWPSAREGVSRDQLTRLRRLRLARLLRRARATDASNNVVAPPSPPSPPGDWRASNNYVSSPDDGESSGEEDSVVYPAETSAVEGQLLAPIPGDQIAAWLELGHGSTEEGAPLLPQALTFSSPSESNSGPESQSADAADSGRLSDGA